LYGTAEAICMILRRVHRMVRRTLNTRKAIPLSKWSGLEVFYEMVLAKEYGGWSAL